MAASIEKTNRPVHGSEKLHVMNSDNFLHSSLVRYLPLVYIPIAYFAIVIIQVSTRSKNISQNFPYEGYFLFFLVIMGAILSVTKWWSFLENKIRLANLAIIGGFSLGFMFLVVHLLYIFYSYVYQPLIPLDFYERGFDSLFYVVIVAPVYLFSFADAIQNANKTSISRVVVSLVYGFTLISLPDSTLATNTARFLYFVFLFYQRGHASRITT